MLSIVLDVVMNAILFVAEHVIAIGNTLQQVDGFLTVVPRRFGELNTTRGSKGGNLVLHSPNAMVDEHRSHRKSRPIYTIYINIETTCHFVDSLNDEILVLRSTYVPCVSIASQVCDNELGRVYHLVHLIRARLIFWVLVHTMCHDEEW